MKLYAMKRAIDWPEILDIKELLTRYDNWNYYIGRRYPRGDLTSITHVMMMFDSQLTICKTHTGYSVIIYVKK